MVARVHLRGDKPRPLLDLIRIYLVGEKHGRSKYAKTWSESGVVLHGVKHPFVGNPSLVCHPDCS